MVELHSTLKATAVASMLHMPTTARWRVLDGRGFKGRTRVGKGRARLGKGRTKVGKGRTRVGKGRRRVGKARRGVGEDRGLSVGSPNRACPHTLFPCPSVLDLIKVQRCWVVHSADPLLLLTLQGEVRTIDRERWTIASGGRILAARSQVRICTACTCGLSPDVHTVSSLSLG